MNTVERVKELAAERDMTLFRLSKLCDVPYSTIKNTELRCGQLSVDTIEITWINGEKYEIDSVLDIRQAAALKAGGHGDRYTVCVGGRCSFLFFERSNQQVGNYIGRWFVERRA